MSTARSPFSSVAALVEHFRAQFVFPCSAAVGDPLEAGVANLAGAAEVRNPSQRAGQDRFIALTVVGRAEGAPDRMIDEDGAWGRDFAHDVEDRSDNQCGDASAFNDMSDETDGLMAEGSVGNEQCQVHLRLHQLTGDGRRQLVFNFLMLAQPAHERKVVRR